jgi:hypothetical protein
MDNSAVSTGATTLHDHKSALLDSELPHLADAGLQWSK